MNTQRQNIYRAITILNSLLIPVFIISLIEKLNLSFLSRFGFIPILLIVSALKIYVLSGFGGCVLELISAEEFVIQFRRFHQNAKNLWQWFLIVFVSIFIVDFFLFSPFPSLRAWRPLYFSLLGGMASYVLAWWVIAKKYLEPLGVPRRKIKFNLGFLLVIVVACLVELIFVRSSVFIHIEDFYWQNILAFMLSYIHVFEFIFCSLFILDDYPEINKEFSRSKEIFLINPMGAGIVRSLVFSMTRNYPPFFIVLKALTPKTYKFREFNQVIWHESYFKSNALVCITCYTSNCYEAYKLAKEFKKRGSTVVLGGPHVTYLPNEALAFCDSVVIGPAEGVWRQVMLDYEMGTLRSQYKGVVTEDDYSQVHEELLNSPPHIAKDFLEITRGCKFKCHFCTIPALSNGQVHLQPVEAFVEVIKKLKPYYSNFVFIDNNIYADPGYARELFTALKPLNIKWNCECTIDIAKNTETLKLARESGCTGLAFGYEISGVSSEKNQGGKFAMARKYIEYTKIIKKAGIKIKGQYIFGFDSDNLATLFDLWKFCVSVMPKYTAFSILTPLPGSQLYRDMLAQNRIMSLNWRSYTCFRFVVSHPHLNPVVVSFFYPLIQVFFFVTTCSVGVMYLAIIIFLCFFK